MVLVFYTHHYTKLIVACAVVNRTMSFVPTIP